MGAQEAVHPLVQGEARVRPATPRQHHHEDRQATFTSGDPDGAEVTPVHLPLLARHRRHPKVGFVGLVARPNLLYVAPELALAPLVASGLEHVVEPRRAQPRILLQRLRDEGRVGGEQVSAPITPSRHEGRRPQRRLHRVGMHTQLARDRAHLPVLCEKQRADPRPLFTADRHRPPPSASAMRTSSRSENPGTSGTRSRRKLS